MQTVKNVFNNVSPIRTINVGEDFKEVAFHVAPEVAVQRVVSRMFGKQAQTLVESALTHTLSVPFIGAFNFMGPEYHPTLDANYGKQIHAGFGGVPAVLFARYLVELISGERFLHVPWDSMRDLLVTIVSKTITRPLVSTVGSFIPTTLRTGNDMLQQRFDAQSAFSYIGSTPGDLPGDHKQLFQSDILGSGKSEVAAFGKYAPYEEGGGK